MSRPGGHSRSFTRTERVRAIGVSNFQLPTSIGCSTRQAIVPAVNQIELHPDLQQAPLRRSTPRTASPPRPGARSGRAQRCGSAVLELRRTARTHAGAGRASLAPPAGQRRDPEVDHPVRIRENIALFDFALNDADMASLALETGTRLGPRPPGRRAAGAGRASPAPVAAGPPRTPAEGERGGGGEGGGGGGGGRGGGRGEGEGGGWTGVKGGQGGEGGGGERFRGGEGGGGGGRGGGGGAPICRCSPTAVTGR